MVGIRLGELITFLDRQTAASFRGDAVDTFLRQNQVELDDLLDYTRFRQDCYARNLVWRTETYELLLLAWLGGQKACIHNHGGQRCWMTVAIGELTVRNYKPLSLTKPQPESLGTPEKYVQGDQVYIDDGLGWHSLENTTTKPTLTLHLYAAPVKECLIYDEKSQSIQKMELVSFPPTIEEVPADPSLPLV
ncbi:cysteine dioxygenase family protein [bacterium]|nr:cysteine dioxygenase family protein [bacterium]